MLLAIRNGLFCGNVKKGSLKMSSLSDSIDALIENIKVSEHYAERQRKELQNVENEINEIKANISTMKTAKDKLSADIKDMLLNLNEKEALLSSLEKEIKIISITQREMIELYEKERMTLNEKQQQVWAKRESFCNQLRKFSEDWGPLGTSWMVKSDPKINIKQAELKVEVPLLEQDTKKLEEDVKEAKKQLCEAEKKLKNAYLEKEKLSRDPDFGEEFIRLHEQLRNTRSEIESLESRCESAKDHHWSQHLHTKKIMQQMPYPKPFSLNQTTHMLSLQKNNEETHQGLDKKIDNIININENLSSCNKHAYKMNSTMDKGIKRPILTIDPVENYHSEKENIQSELSKKPFPFIPKKPTSLSKQVLGHSSSWMQFEKELSFLLQKNTPI